MKPIPLNMHARIFWVFWWCTGWYGSYQLWLRYIIPPVDQEKAVKKSGIWHNILLTLYILYQWTVHFLLCCIDHLYFSQLMNNKNVTSQDHIILKVLFNELHHLPYYMPQMRREYILIKANGNTYPIPYMSYLAGLTARKNEVEQQLHKVLIGQLTTNRHFYVIHHKRW